MKLVTTIQQDIAFIVKDIMICKLGLEESHLQDAVFLEELGVDSRSIVELKIEIETKFRIHISSEEAKKMNTVGSIIHCVQGKM